MPIQIAIDGPASSGKGTVARLVARKLGYAYIDTGSMYRSVALFSRRARVEWDDGERLGALADVLRFRFPWDGERLRVIVNDEDVTEALRQEEIGQGASKVSVFPAVRGALLSLQRGLASLGGVVMEGRDIGTVVLPDAELKVFLDATVQARAARRTEELQRRGVCVSRDAVEAELRTRDARDRGRSVAPLRQATDARYLDTTSMSAEQAADQIVEWARSLDAMGLTGDDGSGKAR
ncbi:MAG: (d)CMP kinase [Myxococcota bacterium]